MSRQYKSSDDLPRGSTDKVVDLRDPLQVQVEASEQLRVKSRDMMISPVQLRCSSQRVFESIKTKDLIHGTQAYLPLKRNVSHQLITSFCIGLVRTGVDFDKNDGCLPNRECFIRGTY